jgi:hypothetical protein
VTVAEKQFADWADRPFVSFDSETTGVDPLKDRIVTASVIRVDGASVKTREWLVDPGIEIPAGATAIHRISTEHARENGMNAQQAVSAIEFGASNGTSVSIGSEHPNVNASNGGANDPLIVGLRAMGHTVPTANAAQSSGISTIIRMQSNGAPALQGGADPRREGGVLGDTFTP